MTTKWMLGWLAGLLTVVLSARGADSSVTVTFGFHNRSPLHWRGGISAACAGINSLQNPLNDKTELATATNYPGTAITVGNLVGEWVVPGAGASRVQAKQIWRIGKVKLHLLDAQGTELGVLTQAEQVYPTTQPAGLVKKIRGEADIQAAPKGNMGAFAKVKVTGSVACPITFSADIVTVGVGVNRTSETPAYPATTPPSFPYRFTATVPDYVPNANIQFDTDPAASVTLTPVYSYNPAGSGNRVYVLQITGLIASDPHAPLPVVRCKLNGNVCNTAQVTVVKPSTQTHDVGPKTCANDAVLKAGGAGTTLSTKVAAIVTIKFKDQYGGVLSSIYNGAVVEEKFTNIQDPSGKVWPANWVAIVEPPGDVLTNGKKQDETYVKTVSDTPHNLTPAQINEWKNWASPLPNNLFAAGLSFPVSYDQSIRVDGIVVAPGFHRDYHTTLDNLPVVPYVITETSQ